MKIPKRITVGKKKYDVVVCDLGPVKGAMGGVSYDNKLVTVGTRSWYSNKRFKQETIIDTFWHEVTRCQSSLRLLSTTLGTLRKVHCATGAQCAHANFTQNIRSKSWHVITKKNTSAT
jgi:hypothetical protein